MPELAPGFVVSGYLSSVVEGRTCDQDNGFGGSHGFIVRGICDFTVDDCQVKLGK